jgi:molecular chaperone GrpE
MERQQQELPERITQQVIEALLPVFDGLDTTVGTLLVGGHLGDDERTALEMLASEQNKALQQLGIQAFDAVGHTFDPAVHDAISEDFRDDVAEGRVVRQVGRGYLLRGRLMRSAQVVIARPSAAEDKG